MRKHETLHKIFGTLFIIAGVILFLTPIPGTTLLILFGFIWLIGKDKTLYFLKETLGKRLFKSFRVKKIVKEL